MYIHIYIYVCVCARVCVCVDHLKRCKTSIFRCHFHDPLIHWFLGLVFSQFHLLQGAAGNVIVLQPTKTAMTFCDIDPGRWIDVPVNFSVMGRGSTQEPPSRVSFFKTLQTQTKSFSFMSAPVRFSQSDGTVVLSCIRTHRTSGKDVERIPSLRFFASNLPNMPVSFTGLFVHVRCIPHQ